MKAIQIQDDRKTLLWEETSDPDLGENEVLVSVHAAGVNRADLLQVKGLYPPPEGASEILGLEMAGEILEVGKHVNKWKTGDRVMGILPGGGYAEKVSVHQDLLLPVPSQLNFKQAAAIPEAVFTSYFNLVQLGNMQPGETVLIHSGAGGIGSIAIQLAKYWGAYVIATTGNAEKVQFCKELGADLVLNYREDNLIEEIKGQCKEGVQLVLDTIGSSDYAELHTKTLSQDGRWLLIGLLGDIKAEIDMARMLGKNTMLKGSTLRNKPASKKAELTEEIAEKILPAFENEKIKPYIDTIYSITEAQSAHEYIAENQVKGKVILEIQ